jgi:hypothetical protein
MLIVIAENARAELGCKLQHLYDSGVCRILDCYLTTIQPKRHVSVVRP